MQLTTLFCQVLKIFFLTLQHCSVLLHSNLFLKQGDFLVVFFKQLDVDETQVLGNTVSSLMLTTKIVVEPLQSRLKLLLLAGEVADHFLVLLLRLAELLSSLFGLQPTKKRR